jgi:hypothetical protein
VCLLILSFSQRIQPCATRGGVVKIRQAEHMDMTVRIDCIDYSAIIDAGPAHRLIP